MNREDCGCKAKGRLFIHVESDQLDKIELMIKEENNYRDYYVIYLKNGIGDFQIDRIAMGMLEIRSNADHLGLLYYPDSKILFEKNNYVHKVTIIDRRK